MHDQFTEIVRALYYNSGRWPLLKGKKLMKRIFFLLLLTGVMATVLGQSVPQQLSKAIQHLERDPQLRHAIVSLCVLDAATGKMIFGHNEQIGLAPASTQKLFTGIAAFELLGNDYRFKTQLGYTGTIVDGQLNGSLVVQGSGDPTLGSWRWQETKDSVLLRQWVQAISKAGITQKVTDGIRTIVPPFSHQAIPDGWIWQDVGNYYGAGAYALNWRENQYDLFLRSGNNPGDPVNIDSMRPRSTHFSNYINELSAGPKGSGDNAYIYLPTARHHHPLVKGTIPAGEQSFSISGAMTDPAAVLLTDLAAALRDQSIAVTPLPDAGSHVMVQHDTVTSIKPLATHWSPVLDSIHFWFQRRSINLYGEALIKTIALEKSGFATTEAGVEIVRDFFSGTGISKAALHMIDGSGLSPQNRVTTDALVKALRYARTRPWFASFYHALPTYNGMKMKSGSIGGARAYAGYHKAGNGKEYIFAIIINNYDGSASQVVRKMYEVLNILK
jgi:D-alanyl-D-alanine carboxypeptidase/D-alanyl-D-alanine-endopeptidase (penicillin-binding protein 4)